jgi:hypothetical protein
MYNPMGLLDANLQDAEKKDRPLSEEIYLRFRAQLGEELFKEYISENNYKKRWKGARN